jgi:hypothetical protein
MHTVNHSFRRNELQSFVAGRTKSTALTIDQIRTAAPSVFAESAHDSRSDRYAYVPTHRVLEGLLAEGFMVTKAEQAKSKHVDRRPFTKHLLTLRHRDAVEADVGGAVPQVLLINSHDGSSAYKMLAGLFRFVCANGLIVSDGMFDVMSIPHVGDIRGRVIEGSFRVIEEAKAAGSRVALWRDTALTLDEQRALANAAIGLRYEAEEGKALPVTADQILEAKRIEDQSPDLWTTFNRVQENLIGGGQTYRSARTRRRLTTREVKSIDGQTSLNRALWRLGDGMARIKAAA